MANPLSDEKLEAARAWAEWAKSNDVPWHVRNAAGKRDTISIAVLVAEIDRQREEIERLKAVDQAFHDLAIKERDAARIESAALRSQLSAAEAKISWAEKLHDLAVKHGETDPQKIFDMLSAAREAIEQERPKWGEVVFYATKIANHSLLMKGHDGVHRIDLALAAQRESAIRSRMDPTKGAS